MAQKDNNQFYFDPTVAPESLIGMEYHLIGIKDNSAMRAVFCMLVTKRVRRLQAGERKIVVDLIFKEVFRKLLAGTTLTCSGCGEAFSWGDFLNSPFGLTHNSSKCRNMHSMKVLIAKREDFYHELKGLTTVAVNMLKNSENVAGKSPADENPQRDAGLDYCRKKLEKMIQKFDEAISMHTAGKYGVCADCDEGIDPARLMVAPNTTQCTSCKAEVEEKEKILGKNGAFVPKKRLDLKRHEVI